MSDYPGAIEMYVDRSRVFENQNDHKAVVIHKTAGFHTAQEVAQFFATVPDMRSAHYIIGQDGTIVQCVREVDGAGANCCIDSTHDPYWNRFNGENLNWHTISIEHVDPAFDNSTPLTSTQKAASFTLVSCLVAKYHLTSADIKPHSSINSTTCPGNYPLVELVNAIRGQNPMNNPNITHAAIDTWNSAEPVQPITTGIAKAWLARYQSGHLMPPPTTAEFHTIGWDGVPVVAQCFGSIRCEWRNGTPTWQLMDGGM